MKAFVNCIRNELYKIITPWIELPNEIKTLWAEIKKIRRERKRLEKERDK